MFRIYDELGNPVRVTTAVIDCSNDDIIVEQNHKQEVNINNIVKRHGIDLIQKTALLRSNEFTFDDLTGNDFQEAMLKVTKARQTFDSLPSELRKQFDNNPAKYMDFVHNPENLDQMVEMGLAQRQPPPRPIEVTVTNPEPVTNAETPIV